MSWEKIGGVGGDVNQTMSGGVKITDKTISCPIMKSQKSGQNHEKKYPYVYFNLSNMLMLPKVHQSRQALLFYDRDLGKYF